jgi:cytochrome c oxidase subunit 1
VYNFAKIPRVTSRYPMWDVKMPQPTADVAAARASDKAGDAAARTAPPPPRVPTAEELGIPIPYVTTKPMFTALGMTVMFCGLILTRVSSTAGWVVLAAGVATFIGALYWWVTSPLEPAHEAHGAHAH